jgi:hypothetical protein
MAPFLSFDHHANEEHHADRVAQVDPLLFGPTLIFHGANLPEATLRRREAEKFVELFCRRRWMLVEVVDD